MGELTGIEWCDHTGNTVIGCDEATLPDGTPHPGCVHCYAREAYATRVRGIVWGSAAEGGTRYVVKGFTENARRWARAAAKDGVRRRVFGGSLCDPLDPDWPAEARETLYQTIRDTAVVRDTSPGKIPLSYKGGLDWILLTKRPWRWAEIPKDIRGYIWLLTSISDQPSADQLAAALLEAQGFALLGFSVEPLIGPVALRRWLGPSAGVPGHCVSIDGDRWHEPGRCRGSVDNCSGRCCSRGIDWVIVGGESGPWARPCDLAWIRAVVDQCRAAGTACFVKQIGSRPEMELGPISWPAEHPKGGDPAEWPEDLRVRQLPEVHP